MRKILSTQRDAKNDYRVRPVSVAAPIGGWDTKSPLALMDPQNAIELVNWYPRESFVELRSGMAAFCTTPSAVLSLIPTVISADPKLLAATQSFIYDVTSGVIVTLASGLSSGIWYHTHFQSGVGVSSVILSSGFDPPQIFNGTTIVAGAYTGIPDLTVLKLVTTHQRRVWFGHRDRLTLYYTGTDQIIGALTAFDLSSIFKRGGRLSFIETWSLDSGAGSDDYLIIGTTEGEIAVYAGTNPAASATWALKSTYVIPRPVGEKPTVKIGGDVTIMTESGVYPLSKVLQSASIDRRISLSDNIDRALVAATSSYKFLPGWCGAYYSQETMLLFNVPTSGTSSEQYVLNVASGAWCKFQGWPCRSIVEWNGALYVGTTSGVRKVWTGSDDVGANISAIGSPAYNYFAKPGSKKCVTEFKPVFLSDAQFTFKFKIENDFYAQNPESSLPSSASTAIARWDTAVWDSAVWASGDEALRAWIHAAHYSSNALGLVIALDVKGVKVRWISTDFMVMDTGVI